VPKKYYGIFAKVKVVEGNSSDDDEVVVEVTKMKKT